MPIKFTQRAKIIEANPNIYSFGSDELTVTKWRTWFHFPERFLARAIPEVSATGGRDTRGSSYTAASRVYATNLDAATSLCPLHRLRQIREKQKFYLGSSNTRNKDKQEQVHTSHKRNWRAKEDYKGF